MKLNLGMFDLGRTKCKDATETENAMKEKR